MIEIEGLSKRYRDTVALEGLNLRIAKGDMFGLIGPNGAGKTTLIRILATLLRPSGGVATVAGFSVAKNPREVRRRLGYLPDSFGVYEELTVEEYLEFFAGIYGLPAARRRRVIGDVLTLTDLQGKREGVIGTLSRGMQQRLGLARVLVHDPDVLLLDEPASGLDPKARVEVRGLLRELVCMGKTILISSHILEDIADLCNRVGLIERGRLVVEGSLAEVMGRVQSVRRIRVRAPAFPEPALQRIRAHAAVRDATVAGDTLTVLVARDCAEITWLPQALIEAGAVLREITELPFSLEEAFLDLTQGEVT